MITEAERLRQGFETLRAFVQGATRAGEQLFAWLDGECSDFVRFNRARVRQAGTVMRQTVTLRLVDGARQAIAKVPLSASPDDPRRLAAALTRLRDAVSDSAPDPFLALETQASQSAYTATAVLPAPDEVVDAVAHAAGASDLVGFHASGPLVCAMVSSLGHAHFHQRSSYVFDFTVYAQDDRAIKQTLAGDHWRADELAGSVRDAIARARLLERPPVKVAPGEYRVLLAPRAVADLVGMLGWDGFSARAYRTGQSPLARLREGSARLSPLVSLDEDVLGAGVPRFQPEGFVRPDRIRLIDAGRHAGELVSPRSAVEFGLSGTAAAESESPQALSLSPGSLPDSEGLRRLGDGLQISNFWYLNHSDRQACRVTGMTRFASFLVRDGEPVAAIEAMRFDDSLYRLLGDRLEALTDHALWMPDVDTWESRQFGGIRAPGALVSAMAFAL